jgi:hypothetical protein
MRCHGAVATIANCEISITASIAYLGGLEDAERLLAPHLLLQVDRGLHGKVKRKSRLSW